VRSASGGSSGRSLSVAAKLAKGASRLNRDIRVVRAEWQLGHIPVARRLSIGTTAPCSRPSTRHSTPLGGQRTTGLTGGGPELPLKRHHSRRAAFAPSETGDGYCQRQLVMGTTRPLKMRAPCRMGQASDPYACGTRRSKERSDCRVSTIGTRPARGTCIGRNAHAAQPALRDRAGWA